MSMPEVKDILTKEQLEAIEEYGYSYTGGQEKLVTGVWV